MLTFILLCYWTPEIALLKLYPRKSHQYAEEISLFLNVTLTKIWIQLLCPFVDGWKENSVYFQQNTFSYEKNEVLSFEAIWRKLKTLCWKLKARYGKTNPTCSPWYVGAYKKSISQYHITRGYKNWEECGGVRDGERMLLSTGMYLNRRISFNVLLYSNLALVNNNYLHVSK